MAKNKPLSSPVSAADEEFSTRELLVNLNARLTKVSFMSGAATLGMVLLLFMMMPLKKSVPYVIKDNTSTGEVSVAPGQTAVAFNPTWANESFFIRRWLTDMFSINQYLTVKAYDPRAQAFLRGQNAITEYKGFRAEDQTFERLAKDPTLTRDVQIDNLTPVAGTNNGAVAQLTFTTHANGKVTRDMKLVTLYYVILPSNDPADLTKNPIGIYITDFKMSSKG